MQDAQNATPSSNPAGSPIGLLARCAASRGRECWDELLERFGPKLSAGVGRALARCGRHDPGDLAEDLMQEVLCRLLAKDGRILLRCQGRSEREIGSYLFRVAESAAIDHLRKLGARKRGGAVEETSASSELADGDAVCGRPGPERRLVLQQERSRFLTLCRELLSGEQPRRDLQIVYLALFQDCSSREIARRSRGRVTPGAVDSLIHRVRRGLAARGLALPQRTRRRPQVS